MSASPGDFCGDVQSLCDLHVDDVQVVPGSRDIILMKREKHNMVHTHRLLRMHRHRNMYTLPLSELVVPYRHPVLLIDEMSAPVEHPGGNDTGSSTAG